MGRRPALSARFKLTLSYAAVFLVASSAILALMYLHYAWPVITYKGRVEGRWSPTPLGEYVKVVWEEVPIFFLLYLGLFVLGTLGSWMLAGRMLRPLNEIGMAARMAIGGSLSHRIQLSGPRDEFRQVADTFDKMLARIEHSVGEHQRFAANASHELRTPLAITRTLLEVARTDPHADLDAALAEADAANTRAIELTEALLLLGRIDGARFEFECVDLSLIAEHVTQCNTQFADQHGVIVEIETKERFVAGAPLLLEQLMVNLIRNAIVHNTAETGHVWIRIDGAPGQARIVIENTGPNLAAEEVAVLAEPFRRGAARTRIAREQHAGAGLGLAIVASICHAHGAELVMRPRLTGGLAVIVTLPAVESLAGQQSSDRPLYR
ncbi:sensor histidine kinase [Microlunatus sp. GCM10028923]|uniref:sensor histidine kinase n=1 Tax=Microlunatus sp. GCM10028923 TaxID=3273400 RepID=UPI00362089F5